MNAGLRHWPRRRWLAAAAAFPVIAVLFTAAAGHGVPAVAAWWTWPWLAVTGALASLVAASYLALPGTGKVIDIGCSPCAAAAGLALGGAVMAYASGPSSPFLAGVATVLTGLALRQRLTDAGTCPAPGGPTAAAGGRPESLAGPGRTPGS